MKRQMYLINVIQVKNIYTFQPFYTYSIFWGSKVTDELKLF